MNFLLANSFFSSTWFLVVVLVVAVGLLLFTSFTRRKKEEQYRNELNEKLVPGAKVRTIGGIYGTIVSVRNTTDGKIVLLETGEGDKTSYTTIHINAILDIAHDEDVVVDKDGNEVPISEFNKRLEEEKNKPAEEKPAETVAEDKETEKAEEVKTEAEPEKPAKKSKKK